MSGDGHDGQRPGARGRQPIFLLPGMISILAGSMIAIHLASSVIFNEDTRLQFTVWFGFLPYRLIAPADIPGGYLPLLWTPFTHAFLHAGWDHLLVNVAWLLIFGTPVARRYGTLPTLAVFLLSSAAGALLFLATTLPQVQILIGASGGIAGLTGAATRFIFQPVIVAEDTVTGERRVLGRQLARLRDLFVEPRTRYFIIIWVVLNAAVPVLPALIGLDVQIAWQAHLGGFFTGLLMAGLLEQRGGRRDGHAA
jgi:membrane associated rhomboid family serine protease